MRLYAGGSRLYTINVVAHGVSFGNRWWVYRKHTNGSICIAVLLGDNTRDPVEPYTGDIQLPGMMHNYMNRLEWLEDHTDPPGDPPYDPQKWYNRVIGTEFTSVRYTYVTEEYVRITCHTVCYEAVEPGSIEYGEVVTDVAELLKHAVRAAVSICGQLEQRGCDDEV